MDRSVCLDEAIVLGMIEGTLDPANARAAEAHVARCTECRQLVSALVRSPSNTGTPVQPALASTELAIGERAGGRQPARGRIPPVQSGQIVAGKYQIDRVIGSGGMGVVVAATHVALGQRVAIKFLLPEACETAGAVARFLREARATVKIQGEHVARVIDVATLESGMPYIVMEHLRGADLAEVLRTKGKMPIDVAVDYVLQACEAIAEAHALGIVHRDLKPANLFLTSRPDGSPLVKVLDFGISKEQRAPTGLTTGEVMMGSPRYMSPEQMRSTRDVDPRTDVWALGTILFELLAGKPVFDADSMAGLCGAIQMQPAPPLRTIREDAPAVLEAIVSRCLEKDATRRVQSVAELARALAPFAPPTAQMHVDRIVRLSRGIPLAEGGVPPSPVQPAHGDSSAPPFGVATAASFGGTSPGGNALPRGVVSFVAGLIVVAVVTAGLLISKSRSTMADAPMTSLMREAAAAPPPTSNPEPEPAPRPSAAPIATQTTSPVSTTVAVPTVSAVRRPPPRKPVATASSAPAAASSESSSDVNRRGLLDRK